MDSNDITRNINLTVVKYWHLNTTCINHIELILNKSDFETPP